MCTSPESTYRFAEFLRGTGVDVEVVELEGHGHEDVIQPLTVGGGLTLDVIESVLAGL